MKAVPFLIALAAAHLAACSEDSASPTPQERRSGSAPILAGAALPTEQTLPNGLNMECACVRDGQCVVLEQIPGWRETRGLSCRWVRSDAAHCAFEERFVASYLREGGKTHEVPGKWMPRTLTAVRLANGSWCSAGA